ncbi:hypothetical protein KEM54_002503, partial [Ascosphaera aggregata]
MLKGEKYAAEKVDVWSLGIILYALISGELPFDEDDDQLTKQYILTREPNFGERFPDDAKELVSKLLSKRALVRPALMDILNHSFLAEYAPHQQAILKLTRPPPFSTPLERLVLDRMRCAGVNIDHVTESVLAQRCDALAGWWALLIEKEERKEKRRERKRKEREAEAKSNRRLSAASSQVTRRISAALAEVEEENGLHLVRTRSRGRTGSRGRAKRRSIPNPQLLVPEKTASSPASQILSPVGSSAGPIGPSHSQAIATNASTRSASPSVSRPETASKGNPNHKHNSTLHISQSQPDLARHSAKRGGRRKHHNFMHQLASIKHWFVESTKRAKSPSAQKHHSPTTNSNEDDANTAAAAAAATTTSAAMPGGLGSSKFLSPSSSSSLSSRPTTSKEVEPKAGSQAVKFKGLLLAEGRAGGKVRKRPSSGNLGPHHHTTTTATGMTTTTSSSGAGASAGTAGAGVFTTKPRHINTSSNQHDSMSPVPLTPRTTYRLSTASSGLRGRKSTSSSVSSIRSMPPQHKHSLSKASSVSSNSVDTVSLPTSGSRKNLRSPHPSIKVLPTTPNASTHLPSGIRLVRGAPGYGKSVGGVGAAAGGGGTGIGGPPVAGKPFGGISVPDHIFNERVPSPLFGPSSPSSMVFARRKRLVFKGPSLATTGLYAHGGGGGGGAYAAAATAGGLGTPVLPRRHPANTAGRGNDGFEDIFETEDEGIVEEEDEEEEGEEEEE